MKALQFSETSGHYSFDENP